MWLQGASQGQHSLSHLVAAHEQQLPTQQVLCSGWKPLGGWQVAGPHLAAQRGLAGWGPGRGLRSARGTQRQSEVRRLSTRTFRGHGKPRRTRAPGACGLSTWSGAGGPGWGSRLLSGRRRSARRRRLLGRRHSGPGAAGGSRRMPPPPPDRPPPAAPHGGLCRTRLRRTPLASRRPGGGGVQSAPDPPRPPARAGAVTGRAAPGPSATPPPSPSSRTEPEGRGGARVRVRGPLPSPLRGWLARSLPRSSGG